MTKMIIDSLRRTGSARSAIRQIIAVQGEGKDAVERVLTTAIQKIEWKPEFRFGASPKPMEQYAFKVRNVTYERFADAASAVMKIHHIELAPNAVADAQIYVQKAVAILEGRDQVRILAEVPEGAKPASIAA